MLKVQIITLLVVAHWAVVFAAGPPPQSTTTTTTTASSSSGASNPIVTNWITTKTTGYNGLQANILKVYYNSTNVFVSSNSIPSYSIGPWSENPNTPSAQGWTAAFRKALLRKRKRPWERSVCGQTVWLSIMLKTVIHTTVLVSGIETLTTGNMFRKKYNFKTTHTNIFTLFLIWYKV